MGSRDFDFTIEVTEKVSRTKHNHTPDTQTPHTARKTLPSTPRWFIAVRIRNLGPNFFATYVFLLKIFWQTDDATNTGMSDDM